jgi:outer membrane immunogenic protein
METHFKRVIVMRQVLLSTLAFAALTGSSLAGDLPAAKSAPVAVEAAFTWTGLYLGGEGGVAWVNTTAYPATGGSIGFSRDPGLAGALAGYNYVLPNNLLIGVESDGGAVLGASQAKPTLTANTSYYADIRGRLGYIVAPQVLIYAAGGVAFGDVANGSVGNDRTGYTIGAGVDWAFVKDLIARVEYRYTDLGRGAGILGLPFAQNSNAVLVGLSYKFEPGFVPFLAKY